MTLLYFFTIYIATLLITRVFLSLPWRGALANLHSPYIGKFRTHHYMSGLVLILVYFFYRWSPLLPIGLALFVDELPLFFIYKRFSEWPEDAGLQYRSRKSILGVIVISVIGYAAFLFL